MCPFIIFLNTFIFCFTWLAIRQSRVVCEHTLVILFASQGLEGNLIPWQSSSSSVSVNWISFYFLLASARQKPVDNRAMFFLLLRPYEKPFFLLRILHYCFYRFCVFYTSGNIRFYTTYYTLCSVHFMDFMLSSYFRLVLKIVWF